MTFIGNDFINIVCFFFFVVFFIFIVVTLAYYIYSGDTGLLYL